MFNPPSATKPCIKCGLDTAQTLIPSAFGCDWQCNVCKNTLHAYAFKDMVDTLRKQLFKLPDTPIPVDSETLAKIKVFLKSTLPADVTSDKDLEVDARAVQQHVAVTGQLPQAGKPMYADRNGMPIPYGEVTRVEKV